MRVENSGFELNLGRNDRKQTGINAHASNLNIYISVVPYTTEGSGHHRQLGIKVGVRKSSVLKLTSNASIIHCWSPLNKERLHRTRSGKQ